MSESANYQESVFTFEVKIPQLDQSYKLFAMPNGTEPSPQVELEHSSIASKPGYAQVTLLEDDIRYLVSQSRSRTFKLEFQDQLGNAIAWSAPDLDEKVSIFGGNTTMLKNLDGSFNVVSELTRDQTTKFPKMRNTRGFLSSKRLTKIENKY